MVEVDGSLNLIYNLSPQKKIIFDEEFLQKLKEADLSELPENTSLEMIGLEFFILKFENNKTIKIFTDSVSCKLKDTEKIIKIFSFDHLKIILQNKIKEKVYKNPYYYSNDIGENIDININEIDKTKIYLEDYIEIKDKETKDFEKDIKSIFNKLSKIYKEKSFNKYSYQFISPNFNSYFPNLKINLTDKFFYIFANNRKKLKNKIDAFLDKNNSSLLYPICGPHGTGKTISALFLHKLYFQEGIRGLYLNLKYYLKDEVEFGEKINALINECFFICDSEDELFFLYNNFITKKNIYDLFYILNDFIEEKINRNFYNIENTQNDENKDNIENKNKESIQANKSKENIEMDNNKENTQIDNNKENTQIDENKENTQIDENKKSTEIDKNKENIESDKNKENTQIDENKKNTQTDKIKENIQIDKNEIGKENDKKNKIDKNERISENNEKNQIYGQKEKIDNKEKDNKIYIILDQYQEKYNVKSLFDIFKNIKILLLSSINDFDVKINLILKYKEDNTKEKNNIEHKVEKKIIRYHYIDDLINENYYDSKLFKELIKDKIKIKQKDESKINEEFDCIYNILKNFGFIPKYFFEYLYYYVSIYDLLFDEYSNIMKKLENFVYNKKIHLKIIQELISHKYLVHKDDIDFQTLNKNDFISKIKYVPLKYINFKKCANEEFYFYYSFPKFDEILTNFIDIQLNQDLFYITDNWSKRGDIFESLLKYQFIVHKKFNVDGYFEVNNLINMDPTPNYININQEYISSKNKIFINQANRYGKSYDFAIYLPKLKQLLLFQAKYVINNGNVDKGKSFYEATAEQLLENFNNLTKENVTEVYLLFIIIIFYNYDIKEDAINVLTNKRINCIFYSYKTNFFYYNFRDKVRDLNLTNSSMILPYSGYYTPQNCFYNPQFEYKEGIYFKYKNQSKDKKIKSKKSKRKDVGNEEDEEEEEEEEENEKVKKKIKITGKNKEERKFKEILFLQKKTIRNKDELDLLYKNIILYIKNNEKIYNKSIIDILGPIHIVESDNNLEIDKNTEYAFIFYLNEDNLEIDYNKKIGLILFYNGVHYYLDLKENKNYNSFADLIRIFNMDFVYAIGKKLKYK